MEFRHDFKIEKCEGGLKAVFNVKNTTPRHDWELGKKLPKTAVLMSESDLLERIRLVESGGRIASLEKNALFALQRQQQLSW